MEGNIKLKVELTKQQSLLLNNSIFASQMFRNHCVGFLKKRAIQNKQWLKDNEKTSQYIAYKKVNDEYVAELKTFKKKYKSKQEQKQHKHILPEKPQRFHELLNSNAVALNEELTFQSNKAKVWLMKHVVLFQEQLKHHSITLPKGNPQNFCVFYNSLPLNIQKSLSKSARNEGVLLYILSAPRSCLVQVLLDLQQTTNNAFDSKNNPASNKSGFATFNKVTRDGGIRFQLDNRLESFTNPWSNQTINTPEFGQIEWHDSGYVLPKDPCKMLTLIKEKTGKVFAVFFGNVSYNDKRLQQKARSEQRKPLIKPSNTIKEFFQEQTVSVDLNRHQGFIQVVANLEQGQLEEKTNLEEKNSLSQNELLSEDKSLLEEEKTFSKPCHILSVLDQAEEEKYKKKELKKECYIKFKQRQLARQDLTKKKNKKKKKKKNPNGLHLKGKHSKRRMQTEEKIACAHASLARCRHSYLRALAQKLIVGKSVVFAEKLHVAGMFKKSKQDSNNSKDKKESSKKKKNNNRSQSKASFSLFMTILEEECVKNNVALLKCDQYDPTSQFCNDCGYHWGKLDTSIRTITCLGCGVNHDRDVNSTANIQFLALYRYYEFLMGDEDKAKLNNVEKLKIQPTKNVGKNMTTNHVVSRKPLAESVNGGDVVSNIFQISHDALLAYIRREYPIDKVIKAIEEKNVLYKNSSKSVQKASSSDTKAPCRKTYHSTWSKTPSVA